MANQTFADALSYVTEKQYEMLIKKNANYGNNLLHFGLQGVVIRLHDKYHRLETLVMDDKPDLVGESVADTLYDISGYPLVSLALMEMGVMSKGGTWRNAQPAPDAYDHIAHTLQNWEALS